MRVVCVCVRGGDPATLTPAGKQVTQVQEVSSSPTSVEEGCFSCTYYCLINQVMKNYSRISNGRGGGVICYPITCIAFFSIFRRTIRPPLIAFSNLNFKMPYFLNYLPFNVMALSSSTRLFSEIVAVLTRTGGISSLYQM